LKLMHIPFFISEVLAIIELFVAQIYCKCRGLFHGLIMLFKE
jgi:hypothetical protein